MKLLLPLTLFLLPFSLSPGCGLDWTLPQAHFEGVDEQGYVSYWEKIGEADLGDGLVIPVHINFNSHRESSSPTLGKGWTLPLLESHVEPVDENTLHVLMPDGWTFLFLRNGNTQTWRGNAGWVGETDGARFTITAPCGWRVKFDAGKIQEIDTPKNRAITIKYNGPIPLEADIDNQPFVQVAQNTATGVAESITIANQKIALTQAQRPRISTVLGKTLLTGFDPALSQLQWPDGNKETFNFATPKDLTPSMVIAKPNQHQSNFSWDPLSFRINADRDWTYNFKCSGSNPNPEVTRVNSKGQSEYFAKNEQEGTTAVQGIDGIKYITKYFVNAGSLDGKIRSVVAVHDAKTSIIQQNNYDEKGRLVRAYVLMTKPHYFTYAYNTQGKLAEVDVDKTMWFTNSYDNQGRLVEKFFANGTKRMYEYLADQIRETITSKKRKAIVRYLNSAFQQIQETPLVKQSESKQAPIYEQ